MLFRGIPTHFKHFFTFHYVSSIPHVGIVVFLKKAKYVGFFNVYVDWGSFVFQKNVVILQPKFNDE